MKEIEVIKEMIAKNQFNTDALLSILRSFEEDVALIPLLLRKEQKVIRSRINDKGDLFYQTSDLSYPPAHCVTRTDRASLKGHPMFYASIFTKDVEKTGAYPRIVSAFETLDILKERHTYQHCIFTQSVWNVKDEAHLFAFPISKKYRRGCGELSMLHKNWKTYCTRLYSKKSREFFSFIGDLMATPNSSCIYEITATSIDYVISTFGFEGIMYPSVPTEGEGLNICLTTETVDKKVKFEGAAVETAVRNDMITEIQIFANAKVVPPTYSSFYWEATEYGRKLLEISGSRPHFQENDKVILLPEDIMKMLSIVYPDV